MELKKELEILLYELEDTKNRFGWLMVKDKIWDWIRNNATNISSRVEPGVMHETLAIMMDNLPENRPLYKDSGQWTIRDEELEKIYFEQEVNETTEEFIKRCFDVENNLYT